MNNRGLLLALPVYFARRQFGVGKCLPANLTISLLYQCNSRCRTCNVYKKKATNLTPDEYKKIFTGLGTTPYWVTLSGGEPFLRTDIADVCKLLFDICRPHVLNIATNGILTDDIAKRMEDILTFSRGTTVTVNVSIDHVGDKHDAIRGVPGNYVKAVATFEKLKALKQRFPALVVGIHTVISQFNIIDFKQIYDHMISLGPDSYVTEIAEKRV